MAIQPTIQFGINIDPEATRIRESFRRVEQADSLGYDIFALQDHPYNRKFAENWTFLTALVMRTKQIRAMTNVLNVPLRPPALLAKQAITLDLLTEGRIELGLGAGGFPKMIQAFGGREDVLSARFSAFKEYLDVLDGFIKGDKAAFSYAGEFYRVDGIMPGPFPTRQIPIWVGGYGPKMLELIGQRADGVILSLGYIKPNQLSEMNAQIDEGAVTVGREPGSIRRGYNVSGTITNVGGQNSPDAIVGTTNHWAERLAELVIEYKQDTLLFWPSGEDVLWQVEAFAKDVIPAVRAQIATVE